jgi:uncharacterized RDD family membrane protein YckC
VLFIYGSVTSRGIDGASPEARTAFLERYQVAAVVTFFVGFMLVKPLMEGWRGRSIGKMAVGLEVVTARDGSPIHYGHAFGRALTAFGIGVIPFAFLVDDLWPLRDERRQTLHDKVAGTIVVRAR